MNETDRMAAISTYLDEVTQQFYSGHAVEHAYRPALQRLMASFDDILAVNDPKRSEHGAPDFAFLKSSNAKIILGYAEAKDITVSLDRTEKTDQMQRYAGYANLFLTDYLEFRFFRNGEKYQTISLGHIKDGKLYKTPEHGERLMRELQDFLQQTPESIKSGRRLAEIMGAKARRIRDNVAVYLDQEGEQNSELTRMYDMMKKMLVHDLSHEKFADMYAQTLVYGLFVARYGDSTPENFTRSEARDLVPASNPFLRHFFDHIVGPSFDTRLGYIVDELCEVFSVSNVQEIVHKHLRIQDESSDAKDPIIHFYEDFLHQYDPAERKRMGAYYTPTPVVKYIVRQVDRILKEDFGLSKGLASTDTVQYQVDTGQDLRHDKRQKLNTVQTLTVPRVQVLDPAVGTATFLNETIKFIYKEFEGQEGRWPSYVNDNLLKRLHGFELMMAPYTIAHLKLGMTLRETGVDKLDERLGVYLTNTLEEGIPQQPDLFSFGLAEAVSEESRLAAEVKSERPVMVVMGNPPYSVSSNNKSKYIENLVADYKKDLNERNIQPLSDDYIKFIRFAEDMVAKNGEGIVAMITNNSYIDGLIHRQMRKRLLQTFDKIYVLDLHGNTKKKEVAPDGSKDVNVFDIQQGVSIILGVKTGVKQASDFGEIYHAELYGVRQKKFDELNDDVPEFKKVNVVAPSYFFLHKDIKIQAEYDKFISIRDLMIGGSSGVETRKDSLVTDFDKNTLESVIADFESLSANELMQKYKIDNNSRDWKVEWAQSDIQKSNPRILDIDYKLFSTKQIIYTGKTKGINGYPMYDNFKHIVGHDNVSLVLMRKLIDSVDFSSVMVSENLIDKNFYGFQTYAFPLYLYHEDGTRTENFDQAQLDTLLHDAYQHATSRSDVGVLIAPPEPEDVLDYIYAVLHSPSYREKYKEFLKIDFPRVPKPKTFEEFYKLAEWGKMLRELHLMKSPAIDNYSTTYPVAGDDTVDKIRYEDGNVYINDTQYFGNVSELAWNFYIGGYQPAQKWLKDRRGRTLTSDDLDHYQRIIKILIETDTLMKLIG